MSLKFLETARLTCESNAFCVDFSTSHPFSPHFISNETLEIMSLHLQNQTYRQQWKHFTPHNKPSFSALFWDTCLEAFTVTKYNDIFLGLALEKISLYSILGTSIFYLELGIYFKK
jgi:hypothetical protein